MLPLDIGTAGRSLSPLAGWDPTTRLSTDTASHLMGTSTLTREEPSLVSSLENLQRGHLPLTKRISTAFGLLNDW